MAQTPDIDLANALAAALGGGYAVGTNIFAGPARAPGTGVPKKAVFLLATGGPPPLGYHDGGVGLNDRSYVVQALVRSDGDDFEGEQTFARQVYDALHQRVVAGYDWVRARESQPSYLRRGAEELHWWSINFEMRADA